MRGREHRRRFSPAWGRPVAVAVAAGAAAIPAGRRGGNPALFRTAAATGGVTGSVKVTGQR